MNIGSGPDSIVVDVSEDAYLGDAEFTISIDGQQIGGTLTATALHDKGQTEAFTVLGTFDGGPHTVSVDFLNDAYGDGADRNLYVDSITTTAGTVATGAELNASGSQSFLSAGTPVPTTVGTGPDSIVVNLSEDFYDGNAEFTISVDGKQIGGTLTTTALHDAGQTQAFTVLGSFGSGVHTVSVDFLNDAYGGSASADRNLYIDSIVTPAGTVATSDELASDGSENFMITSASGPVGGSAPATTVGSGPDGIVVDVSEDAYLGNAEFTISVDGKQVGGTLTATALHDKGQTEAFTVLGTFDGGPHTVSVDFLNDAYGDSASADRNLYVDSITTTAGTVATNGELGVSGSQSFLSAGTATPTTVGTGPDSIVVNLSEDFYDGNAEFTISVDGKQIGGTLTTTALHDNGKTQAFTVLGTFAAGPHTVSVDFLNDAYGGSASTDRNLYVDSIVTPSGIVATSTELGSSGTKSFTVASAAGPTSDPPPATTVGSGPDSIVVDVSEDAYLGNAEFTISVDGQQIGGTLTATALHDKGQTEAFTVLGTFDGSPHTVSVDFLNDAYGGSASADRNLYVDSITTAAGTVATDAGLGASGTQSFLSGGTPAPLTVGTGPDSLVLNVSEDFYDGNAEFTISVDGQQIGGTLTTTALHDEGQTQSVTVLGTFAAGAHTVSVDFLNDTYGGSASADRNLYVDSVQYGTTTSNTVTPLTSSGSAELGFQVPGATTAPPPVTPPPTSPPPTSPPVTDPSGSAVGAPAIPQPTASGDIVGLVLQNPLSTALGAQEITFAQTFQDGGVPLGGQVMALINGVEVAVQMDVKTSYADGSVETAVLTMLQPALAANSSTNVMLVNSTAAPGAAINLATALANYSLGVDLSITNADGSVTPVHIDAVAAMEAALKAGTASYWLQGPNATQAEVDVPVSGSLHVVFDITAYANGTYSADVQFDNDLAMGATGGAVTYNATITQNGSVAYQQSNIQQYQYQNWHQEVWSAGAPAVNVQHDIAALEATGAVQNYDLTTGVSTSVLDSEASAMAAPGWGGPLAVNGVTQAMPTTGGRGDIGPTTQANAAWLLTQTSQAAAYALGQADAAGSVPWNFYNAAAGTWLNTAQYPDIWVDGRGGPGSYTTGLTQQVSSDTGWTTDPAHQPDLSYVAYLMTGSRYYLDELNAQASWSITDQSPAASTRNDGDGNVIQSNQLRGAAWDMREIDEAAYANPAGSAEKAYFTGIANANWSWLVAQLPSWTALEGQTSGYIMGATYPGSAIPPWQQDYFVSAAVEAAEQGNKDALTYLEWSTNFIAGRFLNGAAGFDPHNGATYLIGTLTPSGAVDTTWAQMQASTVAAGNDNGTGWANSGGDYPELALESLAGLITTTESAEAIQAYGYLLGSGAPYIDAATHQTDIQLDIVPRLSDGNLLTGDNLVISNDTINGTVVSGSATADQLINETGSANVTIKGGSGMNLLFAGSGTTSLIGGANADYLFGSSGTDTFSAGAGSNYMMAGTGAATFALNSADVAHDIIAGFKIGTDHLQIAQSTGAAFNTTQDMSLIQGATQDASGSAVLHLSATHDVTLSGIGASQLTRAMFA